MSPGYYAAKLPQLERLAGDIFARFRHFDFDIAEFVKEDLGCCLEVVSFGIREGARTIQQYAPSTKYFVESKIVSLNSERRSAEAKELKELTQEDMDVDIVSHEKREWGIP